jgi:hypothetical protein
MQTYRISSLHLRRQVINFALTGVLVVALVGYKFWEERSQPWRHATFIAFIFGVIWLYLKHTHRREVAFAQQHSLELSDDCIVLHDGPTERRIPYESVERMRVHKPILGSPWFSLQVRGLGRETYYGYEEMISLISMLRSKLPKEVVSGDVPSA